MDKKWARHTRQCNLGGRTDTNLEIPRNIIERIETNCQFS